jgi:alkylation response protein AidB-like acyl-CoA dehydrogenase
MDLALTEDQQFFQETVRKFLEQECPIATVRAWADRPDGYDPAWWRQAAALGFTSFLVSEDDGGGTLSGRGVLDLAIVAEEMGRLVSPGPLVPTNVVADAVSARGTAEQRARVLPGVVSGETVVAWCGPAGEVSARAEGDGFVLDGAYAHVEAAGQAEELLVSAMAPAGATQFLVPVATSGVTVTPLESIDLVRRVAEVRLDGVRVDAGAVLGDVGDAAQALTRQWLLAYVLQCAESVGGMDRVLTTTVEYLGDRYSFGRPLSSYQALKHRVADLKLWLEAAHAITTDAAHALQDDADDAAEIVHAAAAYVGEHGTELVHQAVQLHGGIGVTYEHDLHLYLRRLVFDRNFLSSPARHRERVAAISFQRLEDA